MTAPAEQPADKADTAGQTLRPKGPLVLSTMAAFDASLAKLPGKSGVTIDLSDTTKLDTAGAWVIATAQRDRGAQVTGATPEQTQLLETVGHALPDPKAATQHGREGMLLRIGRATSDGMVGLIDILGFFGQTIAIFVLTVVRPLRLRFTALVHHCEEAGFNAIPIVALMGFLIGIVLAFQGASQLQQFGAEVFVVDLIALSVLRELGILLTAIIVAGRSASAFTASIGSMKMREEVDAMRTLGLDPMELLVLPRVLALVIFMPVLGLVADMAGLVGGGLMAWYQLGVSPGAFVSRLLGVDVSHYLVGLVKAPFFAVIIGVIGCFQGMRVEGNAESLGRLTSRSVVQAIFMVIVADATFSVFFAGVGI